MTRMEHPGRIELHIHLDGVQLAIERMKTRIMSSFADLTDAVQRVSTDVRRVLDMLAAGGNLSPDEQAALDTATASLDAMDAAIDAVSPDEPAPQGG